MLWPVGIVLFLIALVVFLYFWFSWDSFEFEYDLTYVNHRKLNILQKQQACSNQIKQAVHDYLDGISDTPSFSAEVSPLLVSYDRLNTEFKECNDAEKK